MNHPTHEIDVRSVGSMDDEELVHAERDLAVVVGHLSTITGFCRQRMKAIRSMLDRRASLRERGEEVRLSPPDAGRGGLKLVRPEGETPTFSDHAIVRYLERMRGVDLGEVREAMTQAYRGGEVMAGGAIVLADGLAHVRDPRGFVKTIIPLEWMSDEDIALTRATYDRSLGD